MQIWAWERIKIFRPLPVDPDYAEGRLINRLVGALWKVALSRTHTTSHSVAIFRDQLSILNYDQVC